MYKSKIYQRAYHSKENFMVYNFNYRLSLYLKRFKSNSGLNLIDFYFQQYGIGKKKQNNLLSIKRK